MRSPFKNLFALVVICLVAAAIWYACSVKAAGKKAASQMTGGNTDLGKVAIQNYGCGACHTIPGIPGAHANVGPSLKQIGSRSYIAGVVKNTPENLMKWIQNPPGVDPKTAMPHLRVSEKDARDIAAYLYTLK
jgi:cytochrome c2